jgi:hypothetical protein
MQTRAPNPCILPFEHPRPEPLLRIWKTYIVEGRRIRLVGERWRVEDLKHLAFDTEPDPHRPDVAISWRMFDLENGQLIEPLGVEKASVPRRWTSSRKPGA